MYIQPTAVVGPMLQYVRNMTEDSRKYCRTEMLWDPSNINHLTAVLYLSKNQKLYFHHGFVKIKACFVEL